MAMLKSSLSLLLFLLLISKIQTRNLNSISDDDDRSVSVVSRRDVDSNTSSSSLSSSSCVKIYGFLPCADNVGGYIFQIFVFECLLVGGDHILGKGSTRLFSMLGVGIYGGIVFRILMVLSRMALLLASGFSVSDVAAKSLVVISVGSLAGSIVFSLTVQWGLCIIFGKIKFTKKSKSSDQEMEIKVSTPLRDFQLSSVQERSFVKKLSSSLTESGIEVDKQTKRAAGIMLLSMLPILIVEISQLTRRSSWSRKVHLFSLVLTSLALISYFIYQFLEPSVQKRSLEYSNYEHLIADFLAFVGNFAHNKLVTEDGEPDLSVIKRLFDKFDKNSDSRLSKSELTDLLLHIKSSNLQADEACSMGQFMEVFDPNKNQEITLYEFIMGCEKWINEAKELVENSRSSRQSLKKLKEVVDQWIEGSKREIEKSPTLMAGLLKHVQNLAIGNLLKDGKPDQASIESLFEQFDIDNDGEIEFEELKNLLPKIDEYNESDVAAKFIEKFDKNENKIIDKQEFVQGFTEILEEAARVTKDHCDDTEMIDEYHKITQRWKNARMLMKKKKKRRILMKKLWSKFDIIKASFQVIFGGTMVICLASPLLANVQHVSKEMNISSFYIAFVFIPLALNIRTTLSAYFPANQKMEKTSSLTFSELYGGVVMNNILGILIVLAIIYARGLEWNYGAEVLVILVVGLIIGLFALFRSTYPLWACVLAISLYPFSLVLVHFLHNVWDWN